MFGHVAKKKAVHGEGHVRGTVDYVREGPQEQLRRVKRASRSCFLIFSIGILVIRRRVADRRTSAL
jgi:hypothetical protein